MQQKELINVKGTEKDNENVRRERRERTDGIFMGLYLHRVALQNDMKYNIQI